MNNISAILHVNNRPFSVLHYDAKSEKCVAASSTFLAIVTSSMSLVYGQKWLDTLQKCENNRFEQEIIDYYNYQF